MENFQSALFSPLQIREIRLKNRIVISPMCMYSSKDGFANNWHLVHIGSRAVGGAGLILMEATAVSPEGRITPDDLGIWNPQHIKELKNITAFTEQQGAVPGIQLAHAGRKASTTSPWKGGEVLSPGNGGWDTVAPSAIAFHQDQVKPVALDQSGIKKVISDFRIAAERAIEAGFKVLEIHAAHGYLLHQFLSPLSNIRTDSYGGSFENRIRLTLEITQTIREVWPDELPLFVRISATDWSEGGWELKDTVELAKVLRKKGVDLIDCSSGGLVPNATIPITKGYQVPFAQEIRSQAGILTGAVGLITEPREAEVIIKEEKADLVLIARESLRSPYFPQKAAEKLGVRITLPPQYERSRPKR